MSLPHAEDCNYWKTSSASPDTWLDRCIKLIEQFDGIVVSSGYGSEGVTGRAAYLIQFDTVDEDEEIHRFKIVWPVLPTSRKGEELAARRQAATMMYHDIKAKCVSAQVLGARTAFFSWLLLPDGRPLFTLDNHELTSEVPKMMLPLLESKK